MGIKRGQIGRWHAHIARQFALLFFAQGGVPIVCADDASAACRVWFHVAEKEIRAALQHVGMCVASVELPLVPHHPHPSPQCHGFFVVCAALNPFALCAPLLDIQRRFVRQRVRQQQLREARRQQRQGLQVPDAGGFGLAPSLDSSLFAVLSRQPWIGRFARDDFETQRLRLNGRRAFLVICCTVRRCSRARVRTSHTSSSRMTTTPTSQRACCSFEQRASVRRGCAQWHDHHCREFRQPAPISPSRCGGCFSWGSSTAADSPTCSKFEPFLNEKADEGGATLLCFPVGKRCVCCPCTATPVV